MNNRIGYNGKHIENYEQKILAVLNDADELLCINSLPRESRMTYIWYTVQNPSTTLIKANPELFN